MEGLEDTTGNTTDTTTVSAPPQGTSFVRGDVFADDNKRWKDKFYGAQGLVKRVRAETTVQIDDLQTQVATLEAQLAQSQEKLGGVETERTALIGEKTGLEERLALVPELQQTITELTEASDRASRLEVALKYPELLAIRSEKTTVLEDGTEQKTVTNPVLTLIESAALDQETLTSTLDAMVQALPNTTSVTSAITPSAPAPSEPAGNDRTALVAKARDAKERIKEGDVSAWAEFDEISAKIRELDKGQK